MTHFSAVTGIVALLCGEFAAGSDVQLKHVPHRLLRNFKIPFDAGQRSAARQLRRLQENTHDDILHGLDGEVELRHEWSCSAGCTPVVHDRQEATPGEVTPEVDPDELCIEEVETGALERQIDFDLTCLGENLTCDEIENLDYHEELWGDCNQDPDLLYGECNLVCRFGAHPTRRCTYSFDRAGIYGLSSTEGVLIWSHCALLSDCDETTLLETMGLYCNRSAVDLPPPQQIAATAGPLPDPSAGSNGRRRRGGHGRHHDDDGGGSGMMIGIIGAAGGVVIGGLGVFALYKVLGKKAVGAGRDGRGANNSPDDGAGHPSVVVGRPVTDQASGAVAPPAGAAALDDKGGGAAAGTPLGGPSSSIPKGN